MSRLNKDFEVIMEKQINERIKKMREKANITPSKMAKKLNITTKEYIALEKTGEITCEDAKKIANILNTNILKMLYDIFEYNELQEKDWFITMVNEYTAPYIFIREENEFAKKYYESLNKSNNKN